MADKNSSIRSFTRSEKAFISTFLCFLKDMDFDHIHVTDIINRSGFSRGAFYARFTDKYDLAKKIIDHEMHTYVESAVDYIRMLESDAEYKQLLPAMTRIQRHIYENRDLYDIILDSRYPGMTLDTFINKLMSKVEERISATRVGAINAHNNDLYGYKEFYSIMLYIKYWQSHGYQISPEEMARKILDVHDTRVYRFHVLPT